MWAHNPVQPLHSARRPIRFIIQFIFQFSFYERAERFMNAFCEHIYEQQHMHTKIAQASVFLVLACTCLSLRVHAALHLRAGACWVLPKGGRGLGLTSHVYKVLCVMFDKGCCVCGLSKKMSDILIYWRWVWGPMLRGNWEKLCLNQPPPPAVVHTKSFTGNPPR